MIMINIEQQTPYFLALFKRETGLVPSQHNILSAISRINVTKEIVTMDDLERETGYSRDHISKFIKGLRLTGYLYCQQNQADKRKKFYFLTDSGRKKVQVTDYQLTLIQKQTNGS